MNRVDPSTLGWVKTEIDNTLKQAQLALESFAENTADSTRLRFFITHLHQVVGTLQMVELDGAALLATELEGFAGAILGGKVEATEDVFGLLTRAILSLSEYLEQLLSGRPDAPLGLVSLLNELRGARDAEPFSEVSLFNPDLSVFPPRGKERKEEVSDEEYAALANKLRGLYQAALLVWLRDTGNKDALSRIAEVLEHLERLSHFGSAAQLWWVSRGLAEALQRDGLEASTTVKKLFGQVDQQLKKLVVDSEAALIREPADELVKAILYFIGQSSKSTALIADIKRAFDLNFLLPAATDAAGSIPTTLPSQEALRAVTQALGEEVRIAQELLGDYFDPDRQEVTNLDELVTHLGKMSRTLETLGVAPLQILVDVLIETCHAVTAGQITDLETLSLQMAGALLLIENSSRELDKPGRDWQKQIDASIVTLRGLRSGVSAGERGVSVEGIEITEGTLTESEFKQLLGVVASEVQADLKGIEEAFEEFAADTNRIEALRRVPQHLIQIQGAMQILGQERTADLISITNQYVHDIQNRRLHADNAVLDALAVAIGTIEAYIEGLKTDRSNLNVLIDNALRDLDAAVTAKRIPGIDPAQLNQDLKESFTRWRAETGNASALHKLRQNLRDISSLAERQGHEKIKKIAGEMNNLLAIVADDLSFLSDDIIDTLEKSFNTLLNLAVKSLRAEPIEPPVAAPAAAEVSPPPAHVDAPEAGEPPPQGAPELAAERPDAEEAGVDVMKIFLEEAREVQAAIAERLPKWAAQSENVAILSELRRAFHTLNGSGRLAGATSISELAWIVENLLNQVLNGKLAPSEAIFAFLSRAWEALQRIVAEYDGSPTTIDLEAWRQEADALAEGEPLSTAQVDGDVANGLGSALDPVVLGIFTAETRGHLAAIDKELATTGRSAAHAPISLELLRIAHTMQGTSRSLGLRPMAHACERMEEMLDGLSVRGQGLDESAVALLKEAQAAINNLLETLNANAGMSEETEQRFIELSSTFAKWTAFPQDHEPWYIKGRGTKQALPAGDVAEVAMAPGTEEEIDPDLLEIFYDEAVDILDQIDRALGQWRAEHSNLDAVAALQRALHTLKGSARMVSASAIGDLSHNTESLLAKVESGVVSPEEELINLLEEVHDTLAAIVNQMRNRRPLSSIDDLDARVLGALSRQPAPDAIAGPSGVSEAMGAARLADILTISSGRSGETLSEQHKPPDRVTTARQDEMDDTGSAEPVWREAVGKAATHADRREERRGVVRVSANLLDNLSNYAGEVSITRSRMQQQIFGFKDNLKELHDNVFRFRDQLRELEIQAESQIIARPEETPPEIEQDFDPLEFDRYSRLQHLSRGLSESLNDLVIIRSGLDNFVGDVETVLQQQARLNTELQEGLMHTRMVSFSTQTPRLRHIVRQTARELGKRAKLQISGAEVEIDREVLERMLGPFEHMIRNAIGHGIEGENERVQAGKPATGRIHIDCKQEANEIIIRFSDDGAGLDLDQIRKLALEKNWIQEDTSLSDEELIQLIMAPGFSTVDQVTHLSGRGVGMDVVHSEVKQFGGTISLETKLGQGVTFTIRLPLTLSIMQALIVRAGAQPFAIPVPSIINILKVDVDQLAHVTASDKLIFEHMGQVYPFMHLAQRLSLSSSQAVNGKVPVLLVRAGTHEAALQVDALLNREEIVVKPVGPQIAEMPGIAGATILGDGSVVLILDISELWVTKEAAPLLGSVIEREADTVTRQRIVMVVDDSLTVRKVTDRHLRKHGIEVCLAKDGVDALEQLREVKPDVMLVDIEMPRMDGYELTSRMRSNPMTRHIPIIIITSRTGAKHKQKAMGLGANVYLTKPYQEEELVSTIEAVLDVRLLH